MIGTALMVIQKTDRKLWTPLTEMDSNFVRAELEGILHSPQFSSSKRYPAFLRYVVSETLDGNGPQIKERTIGIEVFGRSADYDTNNDTVVRYTAGEVRKRLAIYYHDHEDAALEITIPQGSYVPEFRRAVETILAPDEGLIPAFDTVANLPLLDPIVSTLLPAPQAPRRGTLPLLLLLSLILLLLAVRVRYF